MKHSLKLTSNALVVMAAIMGVSNMGMDSLFEHAGRPPSRGEPKFPVAEAGELLKSLSRYETTPKNKVENAVIAVAGGILESDEMAGWFTDEAWDWYKRLKKMPVSEIKRIWDRYAPYVDALTGGAK